MKFRAILLLVALSCGLSSCTNSDPHHSRTVLGPYAKHLKVKPGMDARGVRLEGCQFVGQDLTGARFDDCDLSGVGFNDCDLTNASFCRAHLTGMLFQSSQVDGADFTDATINGIRKHPKESRRAVHDLELTNEQLVSTRSFRIKNLNWCVIAEANGLNFRRYSICHSTIRGDLNGTVFTDARLSHTDLASPTLDFKQLAEIQNFRLGLMVDMSLGGTLAGDVNFSKMNLTGSTFDSIQTPDGRPIPSLDLSNAIIRDCGFSNGPKTTYIPFEKLRQTASFKMKDLRGLGLVHFDLGETNLSGFDLSGARFRSCDLTNVSLADATITDMTISGCTHSLRPLMLDHIRATITDMTISGCTGLTAQQIRSTWNYKNDRMDGIDLPPDIEGELKTEKE